MKPNSYLRQWIEFSKFTLTIEAGKPHTHLTKLHFSHLSIFHFRWVSFEPLFRLVLGFRPHVRGCLISLCSSLSVSHLSWSLRATNQLHLRWVSLNLSSMFSTKPTRYELVHCYLFHKLNQFVLAWHLFLHPLICFRFGLLKKDNIIKNCLMSKSTTKPTYDIRWK